MKLILILFVLISNVGISQTNITELKFDTKYYKAVDNWVVFPKKDTDSTFSYGFIYLDNQAGFTFNYETKFYIKGIELISIPKDSTIGFMKYRLEPNTSLVSVLNKDQIFALNLPEKPEWLSAYKKGSDEAEYLKKEGYFFNHVGASKQALKPLLRAYELKPHLKGLEFELSFAYNALKQFEEAILILEKAIDNNANDYYFYRELGFSYKNLGKIDKAEKTYRKGIEMSDNDFEISEMAVNMAQSYFELRNKDKFNEWAKLTRKFAKKDSRYAQLIDLFEQKWNE